MPVPPVGTTRSPITAFVVRGMFPDLIPLEGVDCVAADVADVVRNGDIFSIKLIALRAPVVKMTDVRPSQLWENRREREWGEGVRGCWFWLWDCPHLFKVLHTCWRIVDELTSSTSYFRLSSYSLFWLNDRL